MTPAVPSADRPVAGGPPGAPPPGPPPGPAPPTGPGSAPAGSATACVTRAQSPSSVPAESPSQAGTSSQSVWRGRPTTSHPSWAGSSRADARRSSPPRGGPGPSTGPAMGFSFERVEVHPVFHRSVIEWRPMDSAKACTPGISPGGGPRPGPSVCPVSVSIRAGVLPGRRPRAGPPRRQPPPYCPLIGTPDMRPPRTHVTLGPWTPTPLDGPAFVRAVATPPPGRSPRRCRGGRGRRPPRPSGSSLHAMPGRPCPRW